MVDATFDQAHGLRRMFQGKRPRVIHVVAGRAGVGRSSVATNLGLALARGGRATLLVECVTAPGEARVLRNLGLDAAAAAGSAGGGSGPIAGPHGLGVLPLVVTMQVNRAAPELFSLDVAAHLGAAFEALDYVLVTTPPALSTAVLVADQGGRDVVVVLSRAASSITEAYALIKRMSAHGDQRHFYVLANRVASDAEALLIYQNMSQVAQGYLDVRLDLMGFIPGGDALESAATPGRATGRPALPASACYRRLAEDIAGWDIRRARTPAFAESHDAPTGAV